MVSSKAARKRERSLSVRGAESPVITSVPRSSSGRWRMPNVAPNILRKAAGLVRSGQHAGSKKPIEQIDRAIQVNDRLLLVLSEQSMNSD